MLTAELIRRKRDGEELSPGEVSELVAGIADGSVSDAQVGALAMAIFLRGMTAAERVALTGAMTRSGDVLEWGDAGLAGPVLDKHSTGGVGDKVSLLLAPIVAACGAAVPMISGRGLGHTGGTLDKLEAIPGYDVAPASDRLRDVVVAVGCAIVGQTARLAPADRRLYAIRDATGTVESIPLIVGSILSKKLAAGLDALVMDVKVGSGAFLPDLESARELARAIVDVARGNGLPTAALLTDMNQVLGRTAGNAVEVRESIDHLTGAARDERLTEVTLALSAELLVLGGVFADVAACPRGGRAGARRRSGGGALRRDGGRAGRADRSDGGARPASARRRPWSAPWRRRDPGRWPRSTCAPSGWRSSASAGGGPARATRWTTASASPRWRRWASGSGPGSVPWRWCTRVMRRAPTRPRLRCAPRLSSGTAPSGPCRS